MQPPAALSRHRELLEDNLRSLLARQHPQRLFAMLRYHLGWEDSAGRPADNVGKRLRPALCLLTCEAVGGDVRSALPLASALELVHNFSLVHDDVQDRDAKRHGRDTVWSLWGEAQAINAGDALLAIAHLSLARATDAGLPAETTVRASALLSERTLEMVEGQVMDIEFESRLDVSLDEYVAMISRKTGALFDVSLSLGGLAGGATLATVEALGRCGRALGIAFQVRDDMLGVWGAEDRTGKPAASDIRRRKKALPAVFTLATADAGQCEEIERIYNHDDVSDDDVARVLQAMDALGAQAYCAKVAAEYRDAALSELERASISGGSANELRETAEFLLQRDY
ncbi:MAG: polyprenyl synthetase family protein [Chloroflexota bacterium]